MQQISNWRQPRSRFCIDYPTGFEYWMKSTKIKAMTNKKNPRSETQDLGDKAIGSDYAEILSDFFSRYVILEMRVTWHHKNSSVCDTRDLT